MKNTRRIALRCALVLIASLALPAFAGDRAAEIDALVSRYFDLNQFNGSVLVAQEGSVLLKKGYGMADYEWGIPNAPDTKHRIGSITKPFTAVLVLQLIEEGKLALGTSLSEALPYYRKDTGDRVTIRHLLNHTSGIPSLTGLPALQADLRRTPIPPREIVETYCMGDLEFEPGSRYRYNNSGFVLLGAVVEQVTGRPYEEVLRERILRPAGMQDTLLDRTEALIERRASGYERPGGALLHAPYTNMSIPFAAGALLSTVEDLFLLDRALYGETLLSTSSKDLMFTPGEGDYGLGIGVQRRPVGPEGAERTVLGHGGGIEGFATIYRRIPEERLCVVLFNNTGGAPLGAMADGIFDILYGRTPPPPRRPVWELLWEVLQERGAEEAVTRYRELREGHPEEYDFGENQLNTLGYRLLGAGRTGDAIRVFSLNVEVFPESFNPYDSLGEAYMASGDKENAVKNYARSLVLNPGNANAIQMLQRLAE